MPSRRAADSSPSSGRGTGGYRRLDARAQARRRRLRRRRLRRSRRKAAGSQALQRGSENGGELLFADGLQEVAREPHVERALREREVVVGAYDDHGRVRSSAQHEGGGVQAVDRGYLDVHENDVRREFGGQFDGDPSVLGLADHGKTGEKAEREAS